MGKIFDKVNKTGFAPTLDLPQQNQLCAVRKPAAPKPA